MSEVNQSAPTSNGTANGEQTLINKKKPGRSVIPKKGLGYRGYMIPPPTDLRQALQEATDHL